MPLQFSDKFVRKMGRIKKISNENENGEGEEEEEEGQGACPYSSVKSFFGMDAKKEVPDFDRITTVLNLQ